MIPQIRFTEAEIQADAAFRGHTDQIVQAMYDCGCVVLENFLPRNMVQQLATAFDSRIQQQASPSERVAVGPGRYMYLQPLEPPFADPRIYASGLLLPALRQLLGEDCVVSSYTVVVAYPGAEAQRMHRDNALPFGEDRLSGLIPPLILNLAIPLVDLNKQTGATAQHVGSHRKTRPTSTFGFEEACIAYLRMGDAYLMDYRLVHAGTPNRSPLPRPIIYLGYCRHWYLDAENHLDQGKNYVLVPDLLWPHLNAEQAHLLSRGRLRVQSPLG